MNKNILRKLACIIIFTIFIMLIKSISTKFMYDVFFIEYYWLEIIFALIPMSLIFIFKKRLVDTIYTCVFMTLIVIFYIINTNYFIILGDIFSIHHFKYITGGMSIISASFMSIPHLILSIVVYGAAVASIVTLNKTEKFFDSTMINFYRKGLVATSLSIVLTLGISAISINSVESIEEEIGNSTVNNVTVAKTYNFQQFGMLPYYYKEIECYLANKNKIPFGEDKSQTNDMSGILEGYNVFTIMIETGIRRMVSPVLTPNLYQLVNNGIDCVNNVNKNKTNVSEYIGISGNFPSFGVPVNSDLDFEFSLAKMLGSNYESLYFHDVGLSKDIYDRNILMPKLGFNTYLHNDISPEYPEWDWSGNYILDSVSVDGVLRNILSATEDGDNFYAFWTTLQMHGPYYNRANYKLLKEKYYDKLKNFERMGLWQNPLPQSIHKENYECMETYMMAAMDFDFALGKIIGTLKANDLYDKTLFVLYGDHDLYYDGIDGEHLGYLMSGSSSKQQPSLYQTVMVFYNEDMVNHYRKNVSFNTKIEQITSAYVIAPTILDLLGIEYKTDYYYGTSIFSEEFVNETQIFYSSELSAYFNYDFWCNGVSITNVFNKYADQTKFETAVDKVMKKLEIVDSYYKKK